MSLLKIVRAANVETKLVNVTKTFEVLGRELRVASDASHITHDAIDGIKFGGTSAADIVSDLKYGRINKALRSVFNLSEVPIELERKFSAEVNHLPSYHLGRAEKAAEEFKAVLTKDVSAADLEKLTSADGKVTKEIVERNSRIAAILKYLKGKKLKSLMVGTVLFSGASYVLKAVENHREDISGCFRYSVVGGALSVCKVAQASCLDGMFVAGGHHNCAALDNVPAEMLNVNNCINFKGRGCVKCPLDPVNELKTSASLAPEPKSGALLVNDNNRDDTHDNVVYKCSTPSFLDALADLVYDRVNDAASYAQQFGNEITSFAITILNVLKYVGMAMGFILVLGAFAYVLTRIDNPQSPPHYDNLQSPPHQDEI